MDRGAHFHKCDFQVHTPRDINWIGEKYSSEGSRIQFAEYFIRQCRQKYLDAIAITDHHDFTFFPYIKNAAVQERDENGVPILQEKRIIVFPGLELSLSNPPCQAILIIDSEFPTEHLLLILNKLAIQPNPQEEPSTAIISNISRDVVSDLNDLHIKLDTIELLRGRYIILPHVSDGGHKTLLRSGFAEHYRKMPCVGGYLDGSITSLGSGNQNIIAGRDSNYGNKTIAVFQTSDNRQNDCAKLGLHTTWVKWAEPTAEALRQACLAKESRVSQDNPELPQIFISKLDVTNSKFLSSFSIDFNNQYNALIGGRGTGKSTILEYLRWGLCDQTSEQYFTEDLSEIERKRKILIDNTLVAFNGEVRISFEINGISHIVKRNSVTKELLLKIGNSDFVSAKEEDIRQILPIQAYSQKQLSGVGVRTEELRRFIQQPIANEIKDLKYQINEIGKLYRESYLKTIQIIDIETEISKYELEIKSVTSQVENLRSKLTGLSEDDQIIIACKQKYENEDSFLTDSEKELESAKSKIDELVSSIKNLPTLPESYDNFENSMLIKEINDEAEKIFGQILALCLELKEVYSESNLTKRNELLARWEALKTSFNENYETAKKRAASNQQHLTEIQRLESRLVEIRTTIANRKRQLQQLGNPSSQLLSYKNTWETLHTDKIALLKNQADSFTELSNGVVKAEIAKSLDLELIKTNLSSVLSGTRIREDRFDSIMETIRSSESPINKWYELISELKLLSELKISEKNQPELPDTPQLDGCRLNETNKQRIAEILTPLAWATLATQELEFNPRFTYSTNNVMGDEIPFSEASAGQQATALLTILLNQSGTPLIIDQPEDDIDNRAVDDIIQSIWASKKRRQLIFTSHNANMVVNGDAELVICCDYRESGNQTRGMLRYEGAIDKSEIRNEITSVMEGGEKAFKLRKEKYGF